MSTTTASMEVREYLEAVSRELSDLPAEERDELLEDLDSHLREVSAEGEGSLVQRLGPAEQYAAELRASAGLSSSDRSNAGVLYRAIGSLSASRTWRRAAEHPWTRATLAFVPQLRPAWWIVRASLAVGLIAGLYHQRGYHDGSFTGRGVESLYRNSGLLPGGFPAPYIGIVLLVIAIPISISIGRRSFRGAVRGVVAAGNLFAVAMVVPAILALGDSTSYSQGAGTIPPGLVNNGNPVTNIYPYDAQGHPLDHVRLFDQDGQPLTPSGSSTTVDPVLTVIVPTASANAIPNEYPMPNTVTIYGADGTPSTTVLPRPTVVVPALPNATATPTAGPTSPASSSQP
jgi:hypothetical protein